MGLLARAATMLLALSSVAGLAPHPQWSSGNASPLAAAGAAPKPVLRTLLQAPSCPAIEYDVATLRAECMTDLLNTCGPCAHELTKQMLPSLASATPPGGSWATALNTCLPTYLRPLLTIIPTRLFALQRCDLAPHIAQLTAPPSSASSQAPESISQAPASISQAPPVAAGTGMLGRLMGNLPDVQIPVQGASSSCSPVFESFLSCD
jgi:hypothetical protein